MRMRGRLLSVGLGIAVLLGAAVHEARAVSIWSNRGGMPNGTYETTVVSTFTENVSGFGANTVLYGFKLLATGNSARCALYDTADVTAANAATQGIYIDEGGEATQWDTYESLWPAPYVLQTGLTVDVQNGIVTIVHDVKV